jgi:hypothetical protein
MNRHERRSAASDQRKMEVGEMIKAQAFRVGGMLYWFEVPEGFVQEDGLPSDVEIFGPFKTDAEVDESMRLVLLGPQCEVTEGGMWDPAWDTLQ